MNQTKKEFCSLSEAIREGAKLRPQAFNSGFPAQRDAGRSCAIAAAIEVSMGFDALDAVYAASPILDTFPYVTSTFANCPACGSRDHLYRIIVGHLNDDHRWTREAIADWLETEEEKLGFVTLTTESTQEPATAAALCLARVS